MTAVTYFAAKGLSLFGTEKGAWLVDSDSTPNPELASNGKFDSDTVWIKGTGWSIAGGIASKTAGTAAGLVQNNILTVGKTVTITYTISNYTAGSITAYAGSTQGTSRSANGIYTESLAASAITTFNLSADASFAGDIDNVSVIEAYETVGVDETTEGITNGGMELDANWANSGTPTVNERSTAQVHSGTYSRKFTADSDGDGIQSDTFTTTGQNRVLNFWVYPATQTTLRVLQRNGANTAWDINVGLSGLTSAAWNEVTIEYKDSGGGSGAYVIFDSYGGATGDWYIDDVTNRVTGNKVANGNLDDTSLSGWTAGGNTTLSIVAGKLRVTAVANGVMSVSQSISPASGDSYVFLYDIDTTNMAQNTFINALGLPQITHNTGVTITNSITYVSGGAGNLVINGSSATLAGDYFDIDNVSLRLADPDLSANNNGLEVHGEIVKSAVAPGAELVGYGNFSIDNFLRQPYNADLDYPADFFVGGWIEQGATSSIEYIFDRRPLSGAVPGYWGYVTASGLLSFDTHDGTTSDSLVSAIAIDDGERHLVFFVLAGPTKYIYIDQALVASVSPATTNTLANTSAVLTIGSAYDQSSPLTSGTLALWSTDNFAPTAAQIKQVYDDEKILFEPHEVYTQIGQSYSLDLAPQVLQRRHATIRNQQKALDGSVETLTHRREPVWDVTTEPVHKNSLSAYRRFLDSAADGHTFTFDPYGTVASPDLPRNAVLENATYSEQKLSALYNQIAFQPREV